MDDNRDTSRGFKKGQRIVIVRARPGGGQGFVVDLFAAAWEPPVVRLDAADGGAVIPDEPNLRFALFGCVILSTGLKSKSITAEPNSTDIKLDCGGSDIQFRKLATAFRVAELYRKTGVAPPKPTDTQKPERSVGGMLSWPKRKK